MTTYENIDAQKAVNPEVHIGKKCQKTGGKLLRNPFKSGFMVNTIRGVIEHPQLGIPAFTFLEDDSYVECRRCEIIESEEEIAARRVIERALSLGYAWYVYGAVTGQPKPNAVEEVRVLLSPADQPLPENGDLERYEPAEHGPLEDYPISWRSPHFSVLPESVTAPADKA